MVRNLPAMRETWDQSLDLEDPLEKEMAIHSNSLALRISWTEEPGGLWSMVSQRVRQDWGTFTSLHLICWKIVWFYNNSNCFWNDSFLSWLCLPWHQILWKTFITIAWREKKKKNPHEKNKIIFRLLLRAVFISLLIISVWKLYLYLKINFNLKRNINSYNKMASGIILTLICQRADWMITTITEN